MFENKNAKPKWECIEKSVLTTLICDVYHKLHFFFLSTLSILRPVLLGFDYFLLFPVKE